MDADITNTQDKIRDEIRSAWTDQERRARIRKASQIQELLSNVISAKPGLSLTISLISSKATA